MIKNTDDGLADHVHADGETEELAFRPDVAVDADALAVVLRVERRD